MELNEVFVLGAGASFVHGAPLTKDILPYAFEHAEERDKPRLEIVKKFLKDIFHYDVDLQQGQAENFPSRVIDINVIPLITL